MKNFCKGICLFLVLLLLPTAALAMTQEEWNLSCHWKTKCATTVLEAGPDMEFKEVIFSLINRKSNKCSRCTCLIAVTQ